MKFYHETTIDQNYANHLEEEEIEQIEHSIVKNPNLQEADQLAIYKHGRGFELGATVKKIQVVVRAGRVPGIAGLRVADALITRPRCPQLVYVSHCLSSQKHNKSMEASSKESLAVIRGNFQSNWLKSTSLASNSKGSEYSWSLLLQDPV